MTDQNILSMLKIDLGVSVTALDDYLTGLIAQSKAAIETEGINIDTSDVDMIADGMLVAQYAAFLYRNRHDGKPMPRSLRWALNNRLFSRKARPEEDA